VIADNEIRKLIDEVIDDMARAITWPRNEIWLTHRVELQKKMMIQIEYIRKRDREAIAMNLEKYMLDIAKDSEQIELGKELAAIVRLNGQPERVA